jgi:hypothetical protein
VPPGLKRNTAPRAAGRKISVNRWMKKRVEKSCLRFLRDFEKRLERMRGSDGALHPSEQSNL